jgi:peptide/nickel transport system permease protein
MESDALNQSGTLVGTRLRQSFESLKESWGDSPTAMILKQLVRSPGALLGITLIVLLIGSATFALQLSPKDPVEMDLINRLKPPGPNAWMGTDPFGRDIFTRVLYGGRISLLVGLVAVAIGGTTGTLLGAVSGFYGGWIDHIVMRVLDALLSFPAVLLAMAIIGALGPGLVNLMLAVSVTSIPAFGRITRSAILVVRELDYVQAARAVGVHPRSILWRHVFPNSLGPVIVTATLQVASAILAAASLSFLGMGIQPPTPEWGSMLADGRGYIERAPWLTIFPGLAIVTAVIGFNLIGDALRDSLDPTLRGSIGQK